MNIYLLRHAIAVDRGLPGYEDDSQRPLTSQGAAKMRRMAEGMKRLDLEFDLILTSTYLRALQTAQIVAAVFGTEGKIRPTDALTPLQPPSAVIGEISETLSSTSSVLLVGHEPFLSSLASLLLCGDEALAITFKKGTLCKLAIEELKFGRCASLEWLATPKLLSKLY